MVIRRALLVVDVQNDFCKGGALAVPDGETIVPQMNKYIDYFTDKGWPVFFSRDWHPRETKHFKDFGGPWPVHCVQNTPGAAFHPDLKVPAGAVIVSKGMVPGKDGYSGFEAADAAGRLLGNILEEMNIKEMFVGGLATDYCVKASVLDGLTQGFSVYLLADAVKGVNLKEDDSQKAVEAMTAEGAKVLTFRDLVQEARTVNTRRTT